MHLAVGGHAMTGVVVYATFVNRVFHQVVVPTDSPAARGELVVGGQRGVYAGRYIVPVAVAAGAAQAFALRGEWTTEWDWEHGETPRPPRQDGS